MAISTYSELQAAVANWLDRSDLTSRVTEFIALAEANMNRALRVRLMVERSTASVSDAFSATPTDYLEAIQVTMTDGTTIWELTPAPDAVIGNYALDNVTDKPLFFGVVGDQVRYYPIPATSYTATLTYYAKIPALTDSNTSNWVLSNHPDAYLYGALLQAAPFLRDDAALQVYSAGYTGAIDAIKSAERAMKGRLRTEPAQIVRPRGYNINTDY